MRIKRNFRHAGILVSPSIYKKLQFVALMRNASISELGRPLLEQVVKDYEAEFGAIDFEAMKKNVNK